MYSPTAIHASGLELEAEDRPVSGAFQAEQAVLGLILELSDATSRIIRLLGNGRCFVCDRHRIIYQVAATIIRQGKKPDLTTVIDRLSMEGLLEKAGGAEYIAGLLNTGVPSLADQYCQEIIEASHRHELKQRINNAHWRLQHGGETRDIAKDLLTALQPLSSQSTDGAGYTVRSLSEILEGPFDEIAWCVEGLLPSNGLGILSGESGCGKTWLILSLALAVALGEPWLGRFQTTQGTVLVLDEESGERLLRQRLRALGAAVCHPTPPIQIACFQDPRLDTVKGQEELGGEIKRRSVSLVLIDSLVRVHTLDENSASEMKALTGGLARIAREKNCAILLTHHARKRGKGSNQGGQRLRGSTELKAAADVHLCVKGSVGKGITIEHEKARFGQTVPPALVTLRECDDGILRFVASEKRKPKVNQARELILEILSRTYKPILRKDLEAEAREQGFGSRVFSNALGRLGKDGKLAATWVVERTDDGKTKTLRAFSLKGSGGNVGDL